MASHPLLILRNACAALTCAALVTASTLPAQLPGNDKDKAPAPLEVAGLVGTPIDIQSTSAKIVFDVEKKEARAQATMVFEMTADGMPLFDLRQDIASAKFNGEEIDVQKLAQHDLGDSSGTIRILQVEAAAGRSHTLELQYLLKKPQSPQAMEIGWGDGTLDWDFFFSDLNHGRYLEMWFPANLLFDRLAIDVEFEIVGTEVEHAVVTNGTTEVLGPLHWKITFPPHFTSFSAMLVVIPSERIERKESTFKLPNVGTVTVDVVVREDAGVSIKKVAKQVETDMKEFSKGMGPWAHGDRVTIFVWSGSRSMEYDGATTTSMGALRHELHHSWFGRGVKPQDQNAGWWDEAWTVYYSDHGRAPKSQVKREGSPVALSPADPWNRKTPMLSYSAGSMLFSRIALEIGEKELVKLMSGFYTEHALQVATTQDLEAHLVAGSGNKEVHQLFHRYVYGKEGRYDAAE